MLGTAVLAACGLDRGLHQSPTIPEHDIPAVSAHASSMPSQQGSTPSSSPSPAAAPAPAPPRGRFSVVATAETDPVPHSGDAADDPAIWIHPTDPALSVVIGTDKDKGGGLLMYDLEGSEVGARLDGAMNNVDVRGDVVAAGNEEENVVALYRMDPATRIPQPAVAEEIRPELTIYGTCLYEDPGSGRLFAFVTSDEGEIEQWELTEVDGGFRGTFARAWALDSQVEACVADDAHGALYVAEEAVGVWRFDADPDAGVSGSLVAATGGGELEPDVEGITIAAWPDGGGFLIVSSQGNDEYVVYDRRDHEHLATFTIAAGDEIDETSNTDGIDVTIARLGPDYPAGLLVVQDGNNGHENQNFKLVSLRELLP